MKKPLIVVVAAAVALGGCSNLSPGEQRAATGTGIGAAGGAVIGALAATRRWGRVSAPVRVCSAAY